MTSGVCAKKEPAMLPKNRAPTAPGEILEEEFLKPMGLTQTAFAAKLEVPVQSINLIVKGRRAISADMALKLAKALDTTPQFWMNLQTNLDLWNAMQAQARGR